MEHKRGLAGLRLRLTAISHYPCERSILVVWPPLLQIREPNTFPKRAGSIVGCSHLARSRIFFSGTSRGGDVLQEWGGCQPRDSVGGFCGAGSMDERAIRHSSASLSLTDYFQVDMLGVR